MANYCSYCAKQNRYLVKISNTRLSLENISNLKFNFYEFDEGLKIFPSEYFAGTNHRNRLYSYINTEKGRSVPNVKPPVNQRFV